MSMMSPSIHGRRARVVVQFREAACACNTPTVSMMSPKDHVQAGLLIHLCETGTASL